MLILAARRTKNSAPVRFRTLPWHDTHPAKLDLEQRLAPDHLARTIDQAVERLDLAALRALYHGTGSEAHPPERLLRVVLYEIRRGHHSPAEWHRDAHECEPVRWLLRGAVVARSCWYAFRDRVAPVLLALDQQVLAQALGAGLTTATRGAEDGTLVAALASRHKLLNQETLQRRAAQLAAAVADDAPPVAGSTPAPGTAAPAPAATDSGAAAGTGVPAAVAATSPAAGVALPSPPVSAPAGPAALPAWMAATAAGRRQQQRRLEQAGERLEELQGRNQQKWASKRKAAQAIVVSPSEPEAVVARDKEKVYRPLYNVQIVDDLESPLILGYGVFAQQNDTGVLPLMLAQLRQQVGHGLHVLVADGAYAGGADLAAAEREGVTVYAPVPGDGVVSRDSKLCAK